MNSDGQIYQGEKRSPDDIDVSPSTVLELSQLNHHARRAYYAEIRRGTDEASALEAARKAHIR